MSLEFGELVVVKAEIMLSVALLRLAGTNL